MTRSLFARLDGYINFCIETYGKGPSVLVLTRDEMLTWRAEMGPAHVNTYRGIPVREVT